MTLDQLLKFCALTDCRPYMCQPHREGDFIVASNGYIAVRVPVSEDLADVAPIEAPNKPVFSAVIQRAIRTGQSFLPIPELPPTKQCRHCYGTGKAYKCESCDGKGEFEHEDYDYDCKPCGASGQVKDATGPDDEEEPCNRCAGTGESRDWGDVILVPIGDAHFNAHLLRRLATLPGVQLAPNGPDGIAYFTAAGCDGVIMPSRV